MGKVCETGSPSRSQAVNETLCAAPYVAAITRYSVEGGCNGGNGANGIGGSVRCGGNQGGAIAGAN